MIDLRSDTVTRPSAGMRKAMAEAAVGDDVWGDDPTVSELEARTAEMLGKEAGLFVPSGTQSNLVALLSHCQRGDEYLVGQEAHTYRYEGGGAAVLGSIQPQPLAVASDGTIALDTIAGAIKPADFHFARTRLLSLENTFSGRVLPQSWIEAACKLAKTSGLATHLDGARIFNAAVKSKVPVSELVSGFDSVSVCLSKGLGAPVGSVLCASAELVHEARRWRKMLGGGMRQSGILAAAGLYALAHNVERLSDDHANAVALAAALTDVEQVRVDPALVQTNMVFMVPKPGTATALAEALKTAGILVDAGTTIRMVTHLDVNREDMLLTAKTIKKFYQQ